MENHQVPEAPSEALFYRECTLLRDFVVVANTPGFADRFGWAPEVVALSRALCRTPEIAQIVEIVESRSREVSAEPEAPRKIVQISPRSVASAEKARVLEEAINAVLTGNASDALRETFVLLATIEADRIARQLELEALRATVRGE